MNGVTGDFVIEYSSESRPSNQSNEHNVQVHVYCPVKPVPDLPTSLNPPQQPELPPYIIHVNISSCPPHVTAVDILQEYTPLKRESYIQELCGFGAIYLRTGDPRPRVSPRPIRLSLSQLYEELPPGRIYIRASATPKRHHALSPVRILEVTDDFVVISKPAGITVSPTVDNNVECVLTQAAKLVNGGHDTLYITTRLDLGTSGVLMLARKKEAISRLNFALKEARKTYIALSESESEEAPRVGRLKHWMNNALPRYRGELKAPLIARWSDESPPVLSESVDSAKWVVASLEITKVEKVGKYWQSWVVLETGRTHQIRVQFAVEGWRLVGDDKYKAGKSLLHPAPAGTALGTDPSHIGLHAYSLAVDIEGRGVATEFKTTVNMMAAESSEEQTTQ